MAAPVIETDPTLCNPDLASELGADTMNFRTTLLGAAALFLSAAPAFAWDVSVEGPDVFGDTKAIAGADSGRNTLIVQCDSKDTLHLALLIPKKAFDDITTVPGKFLVQIDAAPPITLDADFRNWNDNSAGVVVSGRSDDLIRTILSFENAASKINVGFEVNGNRESASFSARGSTKAIQKLAAACKLSAPTPPA